MSTDGASHGRIPALWMKRLEDIPKPPGIMSDRIKGLLSRALVGPMPLTTEETRELAASVVFHLIKIRSDEGVPPQATIPKAFGIPACAARPQTRIKHLARGLFGFRHGFSGFRASGPSSEGSLP